MRSEHREERATNRESNEHIFSWFQEGEVIQVSRARGIYDHSYALGHTDRDTRARSHEETQTRACARACADVRTLADAFAQKRRMSNTQKQTREDARGDTCQTHIDARTHTRVHRCVHLYTC